MWEAYKKGYKAYLQLEKSLSDHSVEAYLHDVTKLTQYLQVVNQEKNPAALTLKDLQAFVKWIGELGMGATTQARIISGIRSFYKYLLTEQLITIDPSTLLEAPKTRRKLPDTLSFEEIEQLIGAIDLSSPEGTRNKAILETMYSCGLRVSELVGLKISCLYLTLALLESLVKATKKDWCPLDQTPLNALKYTKTG
jgi:integrase/recombinase XerD